MQCKYCIYNNNIYNITFTIFKGKDVFTSLIKQHEVFTSLIKLHKVDFFN